MKLIRKQKDGNKRYIYICNVKVFSYMHDKFKDVVKKQSASKKLFHSLMQYTPPLQQLDSIKYEGSEKYKNCIWQLWLQGEENSNELVKKCFESVRKYSGGRQVIVLSEQNLEEFVEIPDFIKEKYKKGIISPAHFSDYVRVVLLAKYGGTWIDATCLLTREIPKEITDSEFFVFLSKLWLSLPKVPSSIDFFEYVQKYYKEVSYSIGSNWFIHSKPNNIIILTIVQLLENYWKNNDKLLNYFLFHSLMTISLFCNDKNKKCFEKMPKYSNVSPHLLQYNLFDTFDEEIFKNILDFSFIHKLTHKHLDSDKSAKNYLNYILNVYK